MTISTPKFSTLKAAAAAAALLVAGLAQPAMAQVTTDDNTAQEWLERISKGLGEKGDTDGGSLQGKMDKVNKFDENETKQHFADQIKHYEKEVARLDAMIEAMGFNKVEGEDNAQSAVASEKIAQAFDLISNTTDVRKKITNARQAEGEPVFGMPYGDGEGGLTIPEAYYAKYGILKPEEVFTDNEILQYNLAQLQGALYLSDATVAEVDKSRELRFQTYVDLLEKTKEAEDLHTTMQINNAIMLENGRNLALLIDLQTANLNNGAAILRKETKKRQITAETFGDTNTGLGTIQGVVVGLNVIGDIVDGDG